MTNVSLSDTNTDDMVNHGMPIKQRVTWLVDRARRHSQEFQSPESWLERSRYLAQHPTADAAFKCMDGRINIPVATNTPHSIVPPFRNLGGRLTWAGRISVRCWQSTYKMHLRTAVFAWENRAMEMIGGRAA